MGHPVKQGLWTQIITSSQMNEKYYATNDHNGEVRTEPLNFPGAYSS